jgi:hypothetical protein
MKRKSRVARAILFVTAAAATLAGSGALSAQRELDEPPLCAPTYSGKLCSVEQSCTASGCVTTAWHYYKG